MKLLNKYVIYYFLNDDSFKECINSVVFIKAMFTLCRIAFHSVSLSSTIQCEHIFFGVMVSMILKIFIVKHVIDKSKVR